MPSTTISMSTIIPKLHIQHFKSIKDLTLECDRINIFIGRPNAGKSNILEAISLLGPFLDEKIMGDLVRYKSVFQLFNDFDTKRNIQISGDIIKTEISRLPQYIDELYGVKIESTYGDDPAPQVINLMLQADGKLKSNDHHSSQFILHSEFKSPEKVFSPVKRYEFRLQEGSDRSEASFFLPPHGGNFYRIVRTSKELRQEIQNFLKPNGLELMLDEEKREVSVLQREEDTLVRLPLRLLPDTFQRYIFHLAAVMSNQHSVLLFEEPEVHAYGPYIYQLAQHILNDEGGNQYFITTHNPYFLMPLIQEGKDVAVFTTWFENYQTHARRLSETELSEILDYGVDVFLNLDHFIPA
jgi:AAA15 family ATPase/GTPase